VAGSWGGSENHFHYIRLTREDLPSIHCIRTCPEHQSFLIQDEPERKGCF
jgi:hypothetical protein